MDGTAYNGVMPPWGHLSNDEIAAVLNLIGNWKSGNTPAAVFEPFAASEIEQARGLGLTGGEVRERRP